MIRISHQNIRRRERRAVAVALAPAAVFGTAAGAVAGAVADGVTPATVLVAGGATFAATIGAVLLARSAAVRRSAGVSDGFAPSWFARGLPLLALVISAGLAAGIGAAVDARSDAPQTPLWVVPLIVALVVRVTCCAPRKPPAAPVRPPRAFAPETKPVPDSAKSAVTSAGGLTISGPAVTQCPAGCGKPIRSGEPVCTCSGEHRHAVHAECAKRICYGKCPECGHGLG